MTRHKTLLLLALLAGHAGAAAPPLSPREMLPPGAVAQLGHARMVGSYAYVAVSPDGRWLFCGKWFDLRTGKEIDAPVHIPERAYLTRFFSDGSYLVHGNQDNMVFAPKSDTPRARLPFNQGYDAFDDAGHFCLQVIEGDKENEGVVALVDIRHGDLTKSRRVLANPKDAPYSGCLSADGTRAAWLEVERKERNGRTLRLCLYDVRASKLKHVALPRAVDFAGAALSPDGKTAALSAGKWVYLYDCATAKQTRAVAGFSNDNRHPCRFTPDGKEVAVPTANGTFLVPVDPKKPARSFTFTLAAFLPDSRRGIALGRGLVISIHDLKTGKQLDDHSRFPAFDGVRMIGKHVAASWNDTGFLVTWDVRDGKVLTKTTLRPKTESPEFRTMRFSPDGRHVAAWTARGPGLCVIAETATGTVLREVTGPEGKSIHAFFHPHRPEAAVYDPQKQTYRGVDLKTGRWTQTLPLADEGEFIATPDARTLLSPVVGGAVGLREAASGKVRWREPYSAREDEVQYSRSNSLITAALANRGRLAVIVRNRNVTIFDTLSGQTTATVAFRERPRSFPYGDTCAVSLDGHSLALLRDTHSLQTDPVLWLYDLAAEDPTKPAFSGVLPCPTPFVFSLALNEDGSRLVTAHLDGTCVVWDTKKLIKPPEKKTPADPWQLLARADPAEAQPAFKQLGAAPARAVALFAAKLKPAVGIAPARVARWVADLDSEHFDRRAAAERGLVSAHDQAEEALRKAVEKPLSLEQSRRAERLLKRLDPASDPDLLRQARAVELLERIGTKQAVALLESLAKGAPGARLTREARESLERLKRSE